MSRGTPMNIKAVNRRAGQQGAVDSRALILILGGAVAVLLGIVIVLLFRPGEQARRPSADTTPTAEPVRTLPEIGQIDAIRRGIPVDEEGGPPPMARVQNLDIKRERAYPMQPPTIPHAIDNYQVTVNTNRCMLCHARSNAANFQAPPVSVTHYMDRDDQFLATISSRRYFCNQCHVVQTDAKPLVANNFRDIDTVLADGVPAEEQRARRSGRVN